MFDLAPNIDKAAQQLHVILRKAEKQAKWAEWARNLILQHANTIVTLEQEKKALQEQLHWLEEFEFNLDPNRTSIHALGNGATGLYFEVWFTDDDFEERVVGRGRTIVAAIQHAMTRSWDEPLPPVEP